MKNVTEEIRHLHKLARENPTKRFVKLWNNLVSVEWLAQSWEQIRRNRGSRTAGVDKMTDEAVDLRLIHRLSERLKQAAYRPKPVRRVLIPKANGKTRPLGIPTLEDRIVQQALKMLLEAIFEADFLGCSHGFRQGLSPHTALRDVVRHYPNTSWIIEGDIKACFDNIAHGKLVEQISRRVADEKILQLCWQFLRAGYLDKFYNGTTQRAETGLEVSLVALIDTEANRSFALSAEQTPPASSAPETVQETRIDFYLLHFGRAKNHFPASVRYALVDGFYAKEKFVSGVCKEGLAVISRLRVDANLRFLYQGERRAGRVQRAQI